MNAATPECRSSTEQISGWCVRDKDHGLQFKATVMKTVPPTTAEGIKRYLGSGLVKGIGPILANKLVEGSEPRFSP